MFVATVRWESTLQPVYSSRRFTCVSDIQEFRDITQDRSANSAWYVGPRAGVDAGAKQTFELADFTIDGEPRPIRRTVKPGSQTYSVNLGQEAMHAAEPITIAYTYRTLVSVDDHLLQLRVDQPTRGLSLALDYGDTQVEHVSVLDFIASGDRTRVTRSSGAVPGKSVIVEFEGWVFPRSGVAFVW